MPPPALSALLLTKNNASPERRRPKMYLMEHLLEHNHPTELSHERQVLLAQEVRDTRLTKKLRTARRKERSMSKRRTAWSPRRAIVLWGRTGIPFFRA
jgi:hypothetical protein